MNPAFSLLKRMDDNMPIISYTTRTMLSVALQKVPTEVDRQLAAREANAEGARGRSVPLFS